MENLIGWTRDALAKGELHPLLVIAVFLVVFLAVYPFQDRNGRLSRIMTTLLLLRAGYAYVPYSSLESVIEQNKEGYYLALRQTQGTIWSDEPNWQPWVIYFLKALRLQKKSLELKIEREQLILGDLAKLSVNILELARGQGRITVAEAAKSIGVSRNTIKDRIKSLTKATHLIHHGAGCGNWYSLS